ncbi:hypothetical protein [Candidatus Palauibacter sp.]|uniref:hypothetical protein n=1 Tax=Candidatus Palauibacter sp. TaxID=3101350 RepID=UPI003B02757B
MSAHARRVGLLSVLAAVGLLAAGAAGPVPERSRAAAHGSEARYVVELEWPRENIARTLGVARSELLMYGRGNPFQTRDIGGRTCVVGPLFALDIEDAFAFDLDEPVDLVITYAPELTGPFSVGFNDNGGDGIGESEPVEPESDPTLATARVTLDRARFAAHGIRDTDLAIGGPEGIALCDIEVVRSHATPVPAGYGTLRLSVEDAGHGTRGPRPARPLRRDRPGPAPVRTLRPRAPVRRRGAAPVGEPAHLVAVGTPPRLLRRRGLRGPAAGRELRVRRDARPRIPRIPAYHRAPRG